MSERTIMNDDPDTDPMTDQRDAWDSFYTDNHRPWRGVSDIGDVPFREGDRVLEVGCGNGKTVLALSKRGFRVTGVDFSETAIGMCRDTMPSAGEFVCASVTELPFEDSSFDGAVAFHVLEHLTADEMKEAVRELSRVLVPGSHLLLKCFAKGDMRSEKGEEVDDSTFVRGNGILYHYFDEEELVSFFSTFECTVISTKEERTRFGTVRRRIEADLRKPL